MVAEVECSGMPIKVHPLLETPTPTQEFLADPGNPQVVMFEEFPPSCSKRNLFFVGMIKAQGSTRTECYTCKHLGKSFLHDYRNCLEYFSRNAEFYAKQTRYPPKPFQELSAPDVLCGGHFRKLIEGAKLPGISPPDQAVAPTVDKCSSSTDLPPSTGFAPPPPPLTSCMFVPSKPCDSKGCPEVAQLKEESCHSEAGVEKP